MRTWVALAWAAVLVPQMAFAEPAEPEKERCARAFEATQELRRKGQLLEARKEAARCAARTCPAILAEPCLSWGDEIDAETPSLIVIVRDGAGVDAGGPVMVDGGVSERAASGRPVPLDPGRHLVEAEVGGEPLSATVVLRAGEKMRRVVLQPVAHDAEPSEPSGDAGLSIGGWAALGIGGAGLVVGAVAGGLALDQKLELDDVCPSPTSCPAERADDIAQMNTLSHVSTAGIVLGAVGLTVGTLLLLLDAGDDQRVSFDRGLTVRF